MRKRTIIGRNDQGYYYYVATKLNNKWIITYKRKNNVAKGIKNLLNSEINDLHAFNNLLIVKTNDDLVVIENYSQINHDKVFESFNKRVENITINKDLFNNNVKLQKQSNHKKAIISTKVLAVATIVGMLVLPTSKDLTAMGISIDDINKAGKSISESIQKIPAYASSIASGDLTIVEEPNTKIEEENKPVSEPTKETVKKETISKEEVLLNNTIKEYANMFGIDYKKALTLVKENASVIKSEYANQEVGIIRILAEEFYNNPNISKVPEFHNLTSIEREKLLLKFAKVHGINDAETAATLLAVYRLETGNGQSEACVYKNNFGGLRGRNSQNGRYYVMDFKTPEIGAEAMVRSFLNIKSNAMNSNYYNPSRSLEQNMNRIYCGEYSWPTKVSELKQEVLNDYDLNKYINNEKPKQLIK
jgi:hypothetical protein